jgi:lipopolysaccharide biosynthesis glycosyltransferase
MRIVTAVDTKYIPGLIALYNSKVLHAPKDDFTCMVHDTETEAIVKDLGIETLFVDRALLPTLPTSQFWLEESMAMYSRLLIPHMFTEPVSVWMDADMVLLDALPEVDFEGYAVAGSLDCSPLIGNQIPDLLDDAVRFKPAVNAGLLVFNRKEWLNQRIFNRCIELIKTTKYNYQFVVQSVLNLALEGDFKMLSGKWNVFAGMNSSIPPDTLVVHWAGVDYAPWTRMEANFRALWLAYYNDGKVK